MAISDRHLGFLILSFAGAVFAYYTLWTLIMPLVDEGHFTQSFFPDRYYALALPLLLLVVGLSAVGTLIAIVMIKAGRSSAKKTPPASAVSQKKSN